ncbi:MAG TPA: gliding motility-associated C-terminal domain-containing protein, partial [Bacteroidales bacterium]|nr:gliding motility-associated C-terminal domain-containing protein [Bacteroidales bacterium]
EGILTVEPAFFSPDNDGKDDLVTIRFEGVAADVAVTLSVYDVTGRLVNLLANNVLVSSQELFSWDGTTAGHLRAATGSYVIFAELISGGGSVTREKTVVFLGGRF